MLNNNQKAAFCEGQQLLMKALNISAEQANEIMLNTLQGIAKDLK